jgi:hypothetical protein
MYDAVNVEQIPPGAKHVAGYVDGYANVPALRKRFPRATVTTISIHGNISDVLDVEKGAATPESAPAWVARMRKRGRRPIVYISRASWLDIQAIFHHAQVKEPFWWIADWTNVEHILDGSVATQWTSKAWAYDLSAVRDDFPKPLRKSIVKRIKAKFEYVHQFDPEA